jgi:hypothetical protein
VHEVPEPHWFPQVPQLRQSELSHAQTKPPSPAGQAVAPVRQAHCPFTQVVLAPQLWSHEPHAPGVELKSTHGAATPRFGQLVIPGSHTQRELTHFPE